MKWSTVAGHSITFFSALIVAWLGWLATMSTNEVSEQSACYDRVRSLETQNDQLRATLTDCLGKQIELRESTIGCAARQ